MTALIRSLSLDVPRNVWEISVLCLEPASTDAAPTALSGSSTQRASMILVSECLQPQHRDSLRAADSSNRGIQIGAASFKSLYPKRPAKDHATATVPRRALQIQH
jgi:hypothetical protein